MSEIVVGYDGSECSKAALDRACEIAKALGDRVVIVFGYAPGGYGGGEVPTHREAVEEIAEKVTAGAAERDARMIVVGSYGEAPLKGVIVGSTPYKLLHQTERPVLVVPATG